MATTDFSDGITITSAAWFDDVDCSAYSVLSGVAGTNTITATGPATYTLSATRPPVWFIPAATNTGATTINVTPFNGAALGAKNIFLNGSALVGGELRLGVPTGIVYDGTQFNIVGYVSNPTLGAPQATTSGTEKDFTIPSWAKKITVQLLGVGSSSSADLLIQIGDAGGIKNTGYLSQAAFVPDTAGATVNTATSGFRITAGGALEYNYHGQASLTLANASANTWVCSSTVINETIGTHAVISAAGSKSLSAALTTVRLAWTSGAAFDAGSANVLYE